MACRILLGLQAITCWRGILSRPTAAGGSYQGVGRAGAAPASRQADGLLP